MVNMGWLVDIAKTGIICDLEGYLVGGNVREDAEVEMNMEMDVGEGVDLAPLADAKRRGKERDVDTKMLDITNSEFRLPWSNYIIF